MNTLILGATGSIGTAVTQELLAAGHKVFGLSRSNASDFKLKQWGAVPVRGDIRYPADWAGIIEDCTGIIHVAETFTDEMSEIDTALLKVLETAAKQFGHEPRFIYTGGCWLYGETGDGIATETRPFKPLSSWAWNVENGHRMLKSNHFSSAIIHPAMVYQADGGVFTRFIDAAKRNKEIEIWGAPSTRWPLIHRKDLAVAYRLLLERHDLTGHFNASAETGVEVCQIVKAISEHFNNPRGIRALSINDVISEHGESAMGWTLDQQMSADKLMDKTGWRPKYTDFRKSAF